MTASLIASGQKAMCWSGQLSRIKGVAEFRQAHPLNHCGAGSCRNYFVKYGREIDG